MKTLIELSHDDIQTTLPYTVICEARFGARWDTGTRKRRWLSEFTEQERRAAQVIFKRS